MANPPKFQSWESTYDDREIGDGDQKVHKGTGLWGVLTMLAVVYASVVVLIGATPFLILGVAEIVTKGPNCYRVRWRRQ